MPKTQIAPIRQAQGRQSVNRKIVFFLAIGALSLMLGLRVSEAQTALPEPPPPYPPTIPEFLPILPVSLYPIYAAESFSFAHTLAKGYGTLTLDVFALQHILFDQGFLSVLPTGYFGSRTEQAVKKFQAVHGITQTGIVGVLTRKALNVFWQ